MDDAPWCYFSAGLVGADADQGGSGAQLGMHFGLARYFDEDTSIGASIGLDRPFGSILGGSNYSALSGELSIYAAHEPDEGPRGWLSAALGRVLDATFERLYVSGTGTASSTGTTQGFGFSIAGEAGYGIAVDDATWVTPFVRGRLSRVGLDGWTDAGGPFNATIGPVAVSRGALTAGLGVEHDLSATRRLFGAVDWSAIYQSGGGVGASVAAASYSVDPPDGWWGVGSLDLGMEVDLDSSSKVAGIVGVSSDLAGYIAGRAVASYNLSF